MLRDLWSGGETKQHSADIMVNASGGHFSIQ